MEIPEHQKSIYDDIKNILKIFIDGYNNTLQKVQKDSILRKRTSIKISNISKKIIAEYPIAHKSELTYVLDDNSNMIRAISMNSSLDATFDDRWDVYLKKLSCITKKIIENNIDYEGDDLYVQDVKEVSEKSDIFPWKILNESKEREIEAEHDNTLENYYELLAMNAESRKKGLYDKVKQVCITRLRLINLFFRFNFKYLKLQIKNLTENMNKFKELIELIRDSKKLSNFNCVIYQHELNNFLRDEPQNLPLSLIHI